MMFLWHEVGAFNLLRTMQFILPLQKKDKFKKDTQFLIV